MEFKKKYDGIENEIAELECSYNFWDSGEGQFYPEFAELRKREILKRANHIGKLLDARNIWRRKIKENK